MYLVPKNDFWRYFFKATMGDEQCSQIEVHFSKRLKKHETVMIYGILSTKSSSCNKPKNMSGKHIP
jgi:G:T/U-mismatch repair DNA glycosylase